MSKPCNCGDPRQHALAVSSAVFQSLTNATDPEWERYWRGHADLLEQKFTTGHGKHYSLFLKAEGGLGDERGG